LGNIQDSGEEKRQADGNWKAQKNQRASVDRGKKEGRGSEGQISHHRTNQSKGNREAQTKIGAGKRRSGHGAENEGAPKRRGTSEWGTSIYI